MLFPSLDELIAQRIAVIEAEAQASLTERTASEAPEPDSSELEAERRVQRSDDYSRSSNEDRVRRHGRMVTDSGGSSIPAFSDLRLKPPRKRKRARGPEPIHKDLAIDTDTGFARSVKKSRDSSHSSTSTSHRHFSATSNDFSQQILHEKAQTASPPTYDELKKLPRTASNAARRIYAMKEVRKLELRDGKTLNNLGRFNLEPALGYTRGEEAEEPCAGCAKAKRPNGPFTRCIVVAGEFHRACCNCRYNNEASGCTLYRQTAAPTDPRKLKSFSAKEVPLPPHPINSRTESADC
ncbi:hypothetical protein LOCC1_G001861 [Lachnellula occidentalis]|uniref:Uncharacterized protein n=1 Tax=Lachnellula occidentalis TaxID=215460 RepID=A0A8H8SAG2_9HELO|nr:hypothetical protein LOCC1_G001861 [Lachnellula occidentalis]